MTARELSRTTYTGLRELPWSHYLSAITAMAGLVLELYESRLSTESAALCRETLESAESVAGGKPIELAPARQLIARWAEFAASDAPEYDVDGISAALSTFDVLAHELGEEQAHYAALNYVTSAVLNYPTGDAISYDGPTLVRVDLTADRAADSPQGRLLERFVRILREAERDVETGQRRTPATLRLATDSTPG